jgi:small subunit ribosomal protein S15
LKKRAERARLAEANRPHVVVGHRPGDDAKWSKCDLAKVIIAEKDIEGTNTESLPTGEISMPTHFNYGFGEREKEMLFETLPQLTILNASDKKREGYAADGLQHRHDKADQMQLFKSRMLARIVSLRNANAKGIAYDNRRRIIAEFSEPANPEDTGRPEVQGM